MSLLVAVWVLLCSIFLGFFVIYYLYMKSRAAKPWGLNVDETYEPSISILVPMRNEEKIVQFKLENLYKVSYPPEKVQIILVNDASTDKTSDQIHRCVNSLRELNVLVLNRTESAGKSDSLNFALKYATGDIIIVSDADCFWSSEILVKALPYLSDSTVGAITGQEMLLNPQRSWVTKSELFYNSFVQTLRRGESIVHSTIFFQGGFAAYKRSFLKEFDRETDDSGTALNIVQKKGRTLIAPRAYFYTMSPATWKNKIFVKMRRASQLQQIWVKCLRLALHGKLVLPKKIAFSNIFLHIVNPIIFAALMVVTAVLAIMQPYFALFLGFMFLPILLYKKSRTALIEVLQNNFVLLVTLINVVTKRKFSSWRTVEESRSFLNKGLLQQLNLI